MSPEISFVSARYTRSLRNGDSCAHDGWVAPVHNRTVRQATVTSDGFRRACIRRFSWRACDALSRADVKESLRRSPRAAAGIITLQNGFRCGSPDTEREREACKGRIAYVCEAGACPRTRP